MKIITQIDDANILLKSYAGARFQIFLYELTLNRIALRLTSPSIVEVLYIIGIGTESMCGYFSFDNANFSIQSILNLDNSESLIKIADVNTKFEIITSGGFTLAQGLESEFGISFNDFLINEPK